MDYFSRDLSDYVSGFGNPSTEFWLGLDKLASLTTVGAELLIELETFEVVFKENILFFYYQIFRGSVSKQSTRTLRWRGQSSVSTSPATPVTRETR